MRAAPRVVASLTPLALLLACDTVSDQPVVGIQAHSFANSEWSEPVHLGALVNSPFNEFNGNLSKDGLSLSFASDRPGGFGGNDLWVSRRACIDCPWEAAANLGPIINTVEAEAGGSLSIDGLLLFFQSARPGGHGSLDLYVARRADPNDDLGWSAPVNLGPDVNTADAERAANYLQSAEDGAANLYFQRGAQPTFQVDIYLAAITRDGLAGGPAVLVSELSAPNANDASPAVRTDGRELIFSSAGPGRPAALGGGDLFVSTRRSIHGPWSAPERLGTPPNTAQFGENGPSLSFDGRTLLFFSNRPGGLGGQDIWMSTRTPSGH
jgi:hypothetical protein